MTTSDLEEDRSKQPETDLRRPRRPRSQPGQKWEPCQKLSPPGVKDRARPPLLLQGGEVTLVTVGLCCLMRAAGGDSGAREGQEQPQGSLGSWPAPAEFSDIRAGERPPTPSRRMDDAPPLASTGHLAGPRAVDLQTPPHTRTQAFPRHPRLRGSLFPQPEPLARGPGLSPAVACGCAGA